MRLLDVLTAPWAIQPEKLAEIQDIYCRHLKGDKIDLAGIEAQHGLLQKRGQGYEVVNGVAIIPIVGVIGKRMNLFMNISGGASTELVARDFKNALADPEVGSILFEVDSPGGAVDGTSELAQMIHQARGEKPIVTWANGLMASAGYWIGSAADQGYISSDTTIVGSIGVLTRHVDFSKMDAMVGAKRTYIYAGKYKVVGADNKPLSKDDKAIIQAELDYLYSIFVNAIAAHRGVDVQVVLDDMAEGQIFTGHQAIDAGLVDGVATMDGLIAAMSGGELPNPADFSAGALNKTLGDVLVAALEADLDDTADTETKKEAIMAGEKVKDFIITTGLVLEQAPDVAEAFREEGKASIDVEGIKAAAATAECDRIKDVFAQSLPGHEAMVNEIAFDGKTTGPEAAVKVLQATKDKQAKIASDIDADAAALAAVKPSTDTQAVIDVAAAAGDDKIDENASVEDRAKANWDKNPELHAEFKTLATYTAFLQVEENNKDKAA